LLEGVSAHYQGVNRREEIGIAAVISVRFKEICLLEPVDISVGA